MLATHCRRLIKRKQDRVGTFPRYGKRYEAVEIFKLFFISYGNLVCDNENQSAENFVQIIPSFFPRHDSNRNMSPDKERRE